MTTLTYVLLALVFVAILGSSVALNVVIWRLNIEGWRRATPAQRWFFAAFLATVIVAGVLVAGKVPMR